MEEKATSFTDLPEGCIAHILSLTSPADACRLSLVSHPFKSAAYSDAVWEKFLPCDYQNILSRSSSSLQFPSKKELFFYLYDHPILIDDGKKSFSLDRSNGKKCYMIAPRDMTIIWSSTPNYWRWISEPDSRFPEVPELLCVWWLEIRGKISTFMLSTDTKYGAYLVFKIREETHSLFDDVPAEVSVRRTGEDKQTQNVCLDPFLGEDYVEDDGHYGYMSRLPCPKQREDGWFEVELGEYFNENGDDCEVEMDLMEVECSHAKAGLIIQGIEVRPKAYE